MKALQGITVVELGLGPVPGIAAMVLADFGARIVRVEPPGGDPFRAMASSRMWLRGKRSATADLHDSEQVHRLGGFIAEQADAVLTTLDDAALAMLEVPREVVVCRIRGLETRPEAPGYEGVAAAHVGRMQAFAAIEPRGGPGYSALMVGVHATAQLAASATLAALLGGRGGTVEVSLERALMAFEMHAFIGGQVRERLGLPAPPAPEAIMPSINYHPVQCADGRWLQLGNLLPHLLDEFLKVTDLDRAPRDDPEAFRRRLLQRMQEKTADEWMALFMANGNVVAHPYQTTQEALADPDMVANGHVVSRDGVTQLGPIARFSETPADVSFQVPEAGELALPESPAPRPTRKASADAGASQSGHAPLHGITVVEFATIIAAPLACSVLADLGARVVKVETPGGDPFRNMGGGIGAARVNSGKESVTLDLKSSAGREAARALIARSDVLVHNYRPGVPEKLGIGYADARAIRPDLVYVGVSGYGPDGPSALRPSTHPIPGAAMGGVFYQLGGPPPTELLSGDELVEWCRRLFRANEVNPDPNTSMVTTTAVLLGLAARARHGVGQQIRVDMFCANAYANFDDAVSYPGKPPRRYPRRDQTGFDGYGLVHTAEGWVFRTGGTDTGAQRSFAEFLASPAAARAGLVAEARHAEWGAYLRHGPLIRVPGQVCRGACVAGEHTGAVLAELARARDLEK